MVDPLPSFLPSVIWRGVDETFRKRANYLCGRARRETASRFQTRVKELESLNTSLSNANAALQKQLADAMFELLAFRATNLSHSPDDVSVLAETIATPAALMQPDSQSESLPSDCITNPDLEINPPLICVEKPPPSSVPQPIPTATGLSPVMPVYPHELPLQPDCEVEKEKLVRCISRKAKPWPSRPSKPVPRSPPIQLEHWLPTRSVSPVVYPPTPNPKTCCRVSPLASIHPIFPERDNSGCRRWVENHKHLVEIHVNGSFNVTHYYHRDKTYRGRPLYLYSTLHPSYRESSLLSRRNIAFLPGAFKYPRRGIRFRVPNPLVPQGFMTRP